MTRPYTPNEKKPNGGMILHVKRCCEQCGRDIGDVSTEEMDAAIAGRPLPDVADECGCPAITEQLAMFMNARDGVESGTVAWADLGEDGRESYRKDANVFLRATTRLGWAPKGAIE